MKFEYKSNSVGAEEGAAAGILVYGADGINGNTEINAKIYAEDNKILRDYLAVFKENYKVNCFVVDKIILLTDG